jgi:hypothetical protein
MSASASTSTCTNDSPALSLQAAMLSSMCVTQRKRQRYCESLADVGGSIRRHVLAT